MVTPSERVDLGEAIDVSAHEALDRVILLGQRPALVVLASDGDPASRLPLGPESINLVLRVDERSESDVELMLEPINLPSILIL